MSNKSNMTIIGGTRGLGRWMAEHLRNDFNITITSRDAISGRKIAEELNVDYTNDNIDAVKDANIILFCVPIEFMADTIKEVAPHAPEGSLLMDVASIKKEAAEALDKYAPENVEILPCHPMFGPRVPTLERQIIVLTPIKNRSDKWLGRVKEYLTKTNCEIVLTTPSEHDKYMSIVQGLTHFSFIALASTIRKLNINVKESRNFSSPVYSLMLDMVSRIVFQNPYLYYSIQKNNDETGNARKALIKESIYLSDLIEHGAEEDFVNSILESAKHLDEREEALVRSDKAISMTTQKANILTKSIGKEIGLRQSYSQETYVGTVKKVTAKSAIINAGGEELTLNISHIDIMSESELYEWKKNNLKLEHADLSVILPSQCDEKYLLQMFKNIDPVIDAKITNAIGNGSKSIYTFHYTVFDEKDKAHVEEYIKGIGGEIC
ncbi:prephenate dehydrogenase [Methanobrevibacter sp.]|uniref:prephenate dehydrogenase n=1 Tax=Methanobrevibacter sp. TaxID=66852 RepID=UPI0026E08E6C|nr:prephenate dehydrogenase [Methanobrevibacter sp.]MDO5860275.1 prephenate dehydrogenase [Methanobrevibacter sp.]